MTKFRCPSDILITSWLFTAWWSTWPGNHLVPCVAELVGSCIPIHARRCLPDPKCLFYLSGLSLCLSVIHFCLVPVDDMVLFHGMVCDGWLVSYTALPCPGGSGLCTSCERVHLFLVFLNPQTKLPACLSNIRAGAVLARDTIDQFGLLYTWAHLSFLLMNLLLGLDLFRVSPSHGTSCILLRPFSRPGKSMDITL